MTRRTQLTMLAAALMAPAAVSAKEGTTTMFDELFETSMKDKKGITLHVNGQSIVGIVVKVGNGAVEMRSREYSRIVVKLDSIAAASLS